MRSLANPKAEVTARSLLIGIGVGHFNALMVIPFMWMAPAATDPKASQIIVLVKHLKKTLNDMGAGLRPDGYLDLPTARTLSLVVGDRWMSMPWADVISAVLSAKEQGVTLPSPDDLVDGAPEPQASPGIGEYIPSIPGLPDVPGGIVTYGIAAYLIYRHLTKK